MRDTPPEVEERFRAMLLARSGEDRLKMGCSMHTFAQQIVRASVLAQTPKSTAADLPGRCSSASMAATLMSRPERGFSRC